MPQRIVRVHPGSLAARSGIREGETLVSINRTPVLDLVDYQYLTARPSLEMLLEDDNGHSRTVHIHKLIEEPLGLTLESSLMSCPKTCACFASSNRCRQACVPAFMCATTTGGFR